MPTSGQQADSHTAVVTEKCTPAFKSIPSREALLPRLQGVPPVYSPQLQPPKASLSCRELSGPRTCSHFVTETGTGRQAFPPSVGQCEQAVLAPEPPRETG